MEKFDSSDLRRYFEILALHISSYLIVMNLTVRGDLLLLSIESLSCCYVIDCTAKLISILYTVFHLTDMEG